MRYKSLRVVALSIVLGIGILTSALSNYEQLSICGFTLKISNWWQGWLQNFSTGMFGSFVTYLLIEILVEEREKRAEREVAEKKELVKETKERKTLQAQYVEVLKTASNTSDRQSVIDEMRKLDILQEITLWEAILENVNFKYSNLRNAYMVGSNLRNALLDFSDMSAANLEYADLEKASLRSSVLSSANLTGANFKNAILDKITMNNETTLPDGKKWSSHEDLSRFTNPNRSDFWSSPIS